MSACEMKLRRKRVCFRKQDSGSGVGLKFRDAIMQKHILHCWTIDQIWREIVEKDVLYNTENLQKHWLFYGEYYPGIITLHPKSFAFYVNACNYDPERLLFQVHRQYLNYKMSDGRRIDISPESLMKNPENWMINAIQAIYCQYYAETKGKNVFIASCSTTHAVEKSFSDRKPMFSKCGIDYYKIQRRSVKSLAEYPEVFDLE